MEAKCARCGAARSPLEASCPSCGAPGVSAATRTAVVEEFVHPDAEHLVGNATVATPPPPSGPVNESTGSSPGHAPPVAQRAADTIGDDPLLRAIPPSPQGKVLGGVQLVRRLGAGGMGAVYAGQHLVLETTVAIKILPAHLTGDESYEERFKREARLSFEIAHANIVRTLHAGKEHGLLFIQMEFVDGTSAGELVRTRGRLSEARAVQIALDAARGLAEAHRAGIVHRDVKPDNILVRRDDGRAKIADLGLARIAESKRTAAVITGAGTTLGTPAYMAPEQIEDASHVGPSADIYSLGATLFELVCGRPPFASATIASLFRAILETPAPDPWEERKDLSPAVRDVIVRCLQKKPRDRYASCDELAKALEAALAVASGDAPPPAGPSGPTQVLPPSEEGPSVSPSAMPTKAPLRPPSRRRRALLAALATLAIAAALVGSFWLGTEAPGPLEKKTLLYGCLPERQLTTARLKAFEPVTQFLEKATRRKWELWVGASYEDNLEAFTSGKLALAQLGGVTYVLVKEREPGAVALFQRDVDQAFQAEFVVPADGPIEHVEQLRGKEIAFVDELSTAGFVIPACDLLDAKIDPAKDVKARFVHAHDTVLQEVQDGEVDAGAVDARIHELLAFDNKIKRDKVRTIKTSAPFPDDVWVAAPSLDPAIRKRLVDAFTSLDSTRGTEGQTLGALEAKRYVPAVDAEYDDLRAKVKRLRDHGLVRW